MVFFLGTSKVKVEMSRTTQKCCIQNCSTNTETTKKKITMYRFPEADTMEFQAWLKAAGASINPEHFIYKRLALCALHFSKESFEQNDIVILKDGKEVIIPRTVQRLKKGSIPNIFPIVFSIPDKVSKLYEPACVVKDCPGKDSDEIKLFCIPSSDTEAWCQNLKLRKSELNICSRVCSRHFEKSSLGWQRLRKGARPTLNLGHDAKNIALPINTPKKMKLQHRFCCILNCTSKNPPNPLFGFPSDYVRLRRWLSVCVFKPGMKVLKNKYICEKHFDQTMIIRKDGKIRLLKIATPVMDVKENEIYTNYSTTNSSAQNEKSSIYFEIRELETDCFQADEQPVSIDIEMSRVNDIKHVLYPGNELTETCATENHAKTVFSDSENVSVCSIDDIKVAQPTTIDIENSSDEEKLEILNSINLSECRTCVKLLEECKTHREHCLKLQRELLKERSEFAAYKELSESQLRNKEAENQALKEQNELIMTKLKALRRKKNKVLNN